MCKPPPAASPAPAPTPTRTAHECAVLRDIHLRYESDYAAYVRKLQLWNG